MGPAVSEVYRVILTGDDLSRVTTSALDPPPEPNVASVDVHVPERVQVPAHGFAVVDARERLEVPPDLVAMITGRSSHMRDGVTMPGGVVDPGFSGDFALEFFNHSENDYVIEKGEAGGRLTFQTASSVTDGYSGRWG